MNLLTDILTFVGFIAITFGAAGCISKSIKTREERNRMIADNHRELMAAINRLHARIKQSNP